MSGDLGMRRFALAMSFGLAACGGNSGSAGVAREGGVTSPGADATAGDDGGSSEAMDAASGSDVLATSDAPTASDAGPCGLDPLRTGLTATQTGVSVDAFDCPILEWAAHYGEPDPMIFKAIVYVESRFDDTSVACPNDPCGTPKGWTTQESGCYGLMQVVPACGDDPGDAGLLPSGLPNLTTDMTSKEWAQSIFNPDVNIEIGISGVAGNRAQVEKAFPGCTVDQYTMMAVGNYNEYGSTKSCTVYNTQYDDAVIAAYMQYATAAGYPAHAY
jgi:hypothetical protein